MSETETDWSLRTGPITTTLTKDDNGMARGVVTFPVRGAKEIRFQHLTPDKHGVKRAELLIGGVKAPLSYCCDNDGRNWSWHGTPWVEGYQYRIEIDARGVVTFWDRPAPVFFNERGERIP